MKRRISGRLIGVATIVAMVTFGAGFALASLTVSNSTGSTGNGNYLSDSSLAYWGLSATNPTTVGVAPSGGLTAVSTTLATPSQLNGGGGTLYSVGTVTTGDIVQILRFSETTSAPLSTEVEINFSISTGSGLTTTTAYIETQASAPGSTLTYSFYLDAGSAASSSVMINYAIQISQQCSVLDTTCP